jgi:uncharacterized protein
MADVKLFFATDIHGSDRCFRKFLNAASFYKCDVLVMGGDMTGKMLLAVVHDGKGAGRCVSAAASRWSTAKGCQGCGR